MTYDNCRLIFLIISVCNLFCLSIFFTCMWQCERNKGLGEWSISFVGGLIAGGFFYLQKQYQLQTDWLTACVACISHLFATLGTINIMSEAEENKGTIKQIKWIFIIYTTLIFIMLLSDILSLDQLRGLLCNNYLILGTIILVKKYEELTNRIILATCMILYGMGNALSLLKTTRIEHIIIIGLLYCASINIIPLSMLFIYYRKNRSNLISSMSILDEIMTNTTSLVAKIDLEGYVIYTNKYLSDLLGYNVTIKKVNQVADLMHPEDAHYFKDLLKSIKKDSPGIHFTFRVKHADGKYMWVDLEVIAIRDEKGKKVSNILACKNITREKENGLRATKNERKFSQLSKSIKDTIFIQRYTSNYTQGSFLEMNEAACKIWGYSEEDYKALSLLDLDLRCIENRKSRDGKTQEMILNQLLKDKKVMYETEFVCKNGQVIPVEVVDYIFNLEDEEYIMTVVRDISERNTIQEFKKLEKLKSDFLANVSHELRTPLNVIITTLQLLELNQMKHEDKGLHYVQIMKQNAMRLLKLVNNFVCMAKIESGFYEMNKKNYNIVTLVEDICQSVVTYIEGNGISFEFDTDLEEKIIACDGDMIEKVLLNLIANAVKFTEVGGKIEVYVKALKETIQISIKDSGVGIPKDKQAIIFERFRQADKTFTRKQEGCGIGLSLVKHFVAMHEGKIKVESEVGRGTTFIVELPIVQIGEDLTVYNFKEEGNTLYDRALEFSDIYK